MLHAASAGWLKGSQSRRTHFNARYSHTSCQGGARPSPAFQVSLGRGLFAGRVSFLTALATRSKSETPGESRGNVYDLLLEFTQ